MPCIEIFEKIRYNRRKWGKEGQRTARYTMVLFDADNTLLDFNRSEREALVDALGGMGVVADEEMIRAYSEINLSFWKKLERGEISKSELRTARFAAFCEKFGLSLDVPRLAVSYTDSLATKSYLLPGTEALCRALAPHVRLCIITNGLKSVQEGRFDRCVLKPLFPYVFISEVLGAEKPDKAYFDAVAAALPDFDPAHTLVVGDSLTSDINGGIHAGLDTCWFNPSGKPVPDGMPITFVVTRPEEILPLVLGA
jgi:2-haloacid dehalogenase